MRRTLLVVGVIVTFVVAPYVLVPVYDFPAPAPFAGPALYNPYQGLGDGGEWRTANFHAHGRAWGGLTEARQTDSAVVSRYRSLGYDVDGVSDYMQIDQRRARGGDSTFVPTYEHGYNILKSHLLAIDARHVAWLDFPLFQTRAQKQYVIDQVAAQAGLVAIAHPGLRGAYSVRDLRMLTHYDFIEVLNHFVVSDSLWDAALSSGHPVWALGSDDSHDVRDPGQTGAMWTMVYSTSTKAADIVGALRAGRAYAVAGHHAQSDAHPERIDVHGDTLVVSCDTPVTRIDFIGQGGVLRGRALGVRSASYVLRPDDPYVRTVIATRHSVMFLNPVIRYDGRRLARPVAVFDVRRTWEGRSALLATAVVLFWLLRLRAQIARRRAVAPRPQPALA